jgi:hypothetical protein
VSLVGLINRLSTRSKLFVSSLALVLTAYSCSGNEEKGFDCFSNSQCKSDKENNYIEMCLEGQCIEKTGCYSSEEDCDFPDRICYKEPGELFGSCVDVGSVDVKTEKDNNDLSLDSKEDYATCNDHTDCKSGICIENYYGGKICSPNCGRGCPEGLECNKVPPEKEYYGCVLPSTENMGDDCELGSSCGLTEDIGICVPPGQYCSITCSPQIGCPEEWNCEFIPEYGLNSCVQE